MRVFKRIASAALAAVLLAVGATEARATSPSLSYTEFLASAGYTALLAETTANNTALGASRHLQVNSTMSATVAGTVAAEVTQISRTDGTSSSVETSVTSGGSVSGPFTVYVDASGAYLPQAMAVSLPDLSNLDAAVARLGKSSSSYIAVPLTANPQLQNYKPSVIYSGSTSSALALLGDPTFNLGGTSLASYSFTEPVASPNADNAANTDYGYSITMPATDSLPAMTWNVITTFSASHVFLKNTMTLDLDLMSETLVTTQTIDNSISVTVPHGTALINYSALATMGKKIQAENSLMPKAAKIAAKAGKSVTLAKLVAAAKSLKYAYTSVKNGIKLTLKYQNVPGSICVTVVKGKAVTAHC